MSVFVSHSVGILFSFNMQLKRLVISKPASPEANNISVMALDVPGALHFFILAKADFILYLFVVEMQMLHLLTLNFLWPKGTLH